MHYGEFTNTTDKIIHLLYAGRFCGYYRKVIEECNSEFGEELTHKAVSIFEKDYDKGDNGEWRA